MTSLKTNSNRFMLNAVSIDESISVNQEREGQDWFWNLWCGEIQVSQTLRRQITSSVFTRRLIKLGDKAWCTETHQCRDNSGFSGESACLT